MPADEPTVVHHDRPDSRFLPRGELPGAELLLESVGNVCGKVGGALQGLDQGLGIGRARVFVALECERDLGGGEPDVAEEIPVASVDLLETLVGFFGVEAMDNGAAPLVVEGTGAVVLRQPRLAAISGLGTI